MSSLNQGKMHGSIHIRPMSKDDNKKVAQLMLGVYDPRYWFWSQLVYGVILARRESPVLILATFGILIALTGSVFYSAAIVSVVLLFLATTLTYQFWIYVKLSPDLLSETSFERYCMTDGGGFWVAICSESCCQAEGRILGTAALVRNSECEAEIFRMAVARDAERKGVASKLLEKVEHFAREKDYKTLKLWTSNAQYKGLRFYLSRGFELVEREWHANRPMPITVNVLRKIL